MMNKVELVDVTLRDGHQSLWAERMTTGMMLPVIEQLDRAGFNALEVLSPSFIGKCVRDLCEDPFERMRLLYKKGGSTPLRVNAGGLNVFGVDQPAMLDLFWRILAGTGIQEVRVSDSWNDPMVWKLRAGAASKAGVKPIINITYSISPKHTTEYYVEKTKQALMLNPFRICLKDPGGLLTPERTRELVPRMLALAKTTPLELHTHCSTGLGPLCVIEAVKLGIKIINTSIPPLADDASLPSVFNVITNLRVLGYEVDVDENLLYPIKAHFERIAQLEKLPIGRPVEFDCSQYIHQVPGGMISNLRNQLKEVGAEDKLPSALEEAIQVRADFGYPIMVTPLSQFVGSQAAVNVMTGKRYEQVTDQSIRFALGHFGGNVEHDMNPEVREKILNSPRAKELSKSNFIELSLKELRKNLDAESLTDEDFLLSYLLRKEDIQKMRSKGNEVKLYQGPEINLPSLIRDLSSVAKGNMIHISKVGFNLTIH
jgi:oxaloacetate decarboxylase (Na+ extruding) subunit alpha